MHLGMSGAFRIDELGGVSPGGAEPGRHDHVIFEMSTPATITFNDPRRFGSMDLVSRADWLAHPVLGGLGPEPLSDEFDAAALARACRGKRTSLKVALLDQRVVAGLGNIYVSEALHRARLSPRRRASTIATPSGAPRDSARRLDFCNQGRAARGGRRVTKPTHHAHAAGRGSTSTTASTSGASTKTARAPSGASRRRPGRRSTVRSVRGERRTPPAAPPGSALLAKG